MKELRKLDKGKAKKILDYLDKKIAKMVDPSEAGKALTGKLASFWRYRVGDMRVICHIDQNIITVLVLRIAHRSVVYDDEKTISAKANKEVDALKKRNPKDRKQ